MGRLKNKIKNIIIGIIPSWVKHEIISKLEDAQGKSKENVYYSHEGEDIILKKYFNTKNNGFYIDVGAHHPIIFSNTYLFYLQGWQGINIDATPNSMKAFNELRPRDINLEIPISDREEMLTYKIFNVPALNTFSEEEAKKKDGLKHYKILKRVKLHTNTLRSILNKYLPQNTKIDFLTIDVEGWDFKVLKSNDWNKYRPTIILIESLNMSMENTQNNQMFSYLKEVGYEFIAKTSNTLFFKKINP